jgi:leucyl-tRNA synthetase
MSEGPFRFSPPTVLSRRSSTVSTYDIHAIEKKWRPVWERMDPFRADHSAAGPDDRRETRYVLDMFAYPSGDLHMGHAEAYAFGDIVARYWRQRGHRVLHPVGWDAFGLPAENAAIADGSHPAYWTRANIATQAESFRRYAMGVDWSRRLDTCDPAFYRWTQWLFIRLLRHGLAYRKRAPVNWCPRDATVLANEQVVDGVCERCGTPVTERELTQWFIRTTAYAQRLLDDMAQLTGGWPARVLTMQRNWIGRRVADDGTVTWRLRDWLVSRQRFWGCPIPVVHCRDCGPVPVPDDALPVELPDLRGADLTPKGRSPLAAATDWVHTTCPSCGGPGTRDTDTMDTFVDSSWYFLRYCSPGFDGGPFDPDAARRWLPVDLYVGGVEHATGHLLYARFITKVLYDLGLVEVPEPFRRLLNQGQVINAGAAMSKSLGNGVALAEQLDTYGVDAVRTAIVFAGPPGEDIDWADVSMTGVQRFLRRAWQLAGEVSSAPGADPAAGDTALRRVTHRTVVEVTGCVEGHRFNVAVARLMELTAAVRAAVDRGPGAADPAVREAVEALSVMLSLVAPYTAEDMWHRLGHEPTVARAGWPRVDPALAAVDTVTCVVQVAGRVADRLPVPPDIGEDDLRQRALASAAVRDALGGRSVERMIVRPPRLVNFVPG